MPIPYIADKRSVHDAAELIATFGADAGAAARVRADGYRDRGNAARFCHWRQVQRLVALLSSRDATGTLH